jgi:hypothetical protein
MGERVGMDGKRSVALERLAGGLELMVVEERAAMHVLTSLVAVGEDAARSSASSALAIASGRSLASVMSATR